MKIRRPFETSFCFLKIYGLWIESEDSSGSKMLKILPVIFCPILFWILIIAGIYEKGISIEMAGSIAFSVAATVEILRIFDLRLKLNDIKETYKTIEEITNDHVTNGDFIKKRMSFALKVYIVIVINSVISVIAGDLESLQSGQLAYPIAAPFSTEEGTTGFWVMYGYLAVCLSYIGPVYVILGWMPMFFMSFAIGFMEDFNESLERFGEDEEMEDGKINDELMTKRLHKIIETHEKLKSYIQEIGRIFEFSFFIKGIAGSVILCTSLFVLPLVSFYNFFLIFLYTFIKFSSKQTFRIPSNWDFSHRPCSMKSLCIATMEMR